MHPFFWTIEDFVEGELLPFVFADAEDERQQYTMVVHNVAAALKREGAAVGTNGEWRINGVTIRTYRQLVDVIVERVNDGDWAGPAIGMGTINAFVRRLLSSQRSLARLVRADVDRPLRHRIETADSQVTVVDLHNLDDRAKRFVVGVTLRSAFDDKERSGLARPLLFVVLDELNKYAPRDGDSPIKEILLDVAERGRSLGIILIGAQQTASEVERRIISNSAIRVVGRLDPAEATRPEYGFLPAAHQQRAVIAKPGTMFVMQPEIPVPLVAEFPFPSWATRPSERGENPGRDRRARDPRGSPRGLAARSPSLRRRACGFSTRPIGTSANCSAGSRGSTSTARYSTEIAEIASREKVDLVLVVGDLFESAAPTPEAEAVVWDALLALRESGAHVVVVGGNHDQQSRLDAIAPLLDQLGITVVGLPAGPDRAVVHLDGARVVAMPWVSQRWAIKTDQLMGATAAESVQYYAARVTRLLEWLCRSFGTDTINIVAAHAMVQGGRLGGGERDAQLIDEYAVPAAAFPAGAAYVALGHLHRAQQIPGAAPIWYCGSPIQVDFGEERDVKQVLLIDAAGSGAARVTPVHLQSGWKLRTISGTLAELSALSGRRRRLPACVRARAATRRTGRRGADAPAQCG